MDFTDVDVVLWVSRECDAKLLSCSGLSLVSSRHDILQQVTAFWICSSLDLLLIMD
jgi:hypothetical protein